MARRDSRDAPGAEESDAQLVAAVVGGDRDAGRRLFDRLAPDVRRLLRRAFGARRDVDDMLQDVFFYVFRDLGKLRSPDALRFFVMSIAANVLRNQIRRDKLRMMVGLTHSGELPEAAPASIGAEGVQVVARGRLHALLERLSATDRMIFILRHQEELDLQEVAETLDISLATVKRRLVRTTERLARQVRNDPFLNELLVRDEPEAATERQR